MAFGDPSAAGGAITCLGISGVDEPSGLEQQNVALVFGDRAMLHASGDDDHLAFTQRNGSVTEFHGELSVNHQEEFVLIFVSMPIESPLKLREFDFLIIERSNDPG